MRIILALILALCLPLVLTAGCGGAKEDPTTAMPDSAYPGMDFTSPEVQQMSGELATQEKLTEVVMDWLEGNTIFLPNTEMGKITYQDFADYIGADATEYKFDTLYNARAYTWIAKDAENSQLCVWFKDDGGKWCLSMTGSANLSR